MIVLLGLPFISFGPCEIKRKAVGIKKWISLRSSIESFKRRVVYMIAIVRYEGAVPPQYAESESFES